MIVVVGRLKARFAQQVVDPHETKLRQAPIFIVQRDQRGYFFLPTADAFVDIVDDRPIVGPAFLLQGGGPAKILLHGFLEGYFQSGDLFRFFLLFARKPIYQGMDGIVVIAGFDQFPGRRARGEEEDDEQDRN